MRILIWLDEFWPEIGGQGIFGMHMVRELQRRGHSCLVITNQRASIDPKLGFYYQVPVHRFSFANALLKKDPAGVRSIHETCVHLITEFKPDVIHLNGVRGSAFYFVLQQRNRRTPTVMTLHDDFLFQLSNDLNQWLLQNVDALAAVSESIRKRALAYDPGLSARLQTVLNALPMPDLLPTPHPSPRRILAFGRIVKEKGFDLAIKAFARVAARFPDASLTIAGNGPEGPSLEALARETQVADRVHFSGWVRPESIPELINQHDLVLMPSRWQEPFGLAALQTAMMGRPIIASRVGGIPEIVVDGVTGRLFENDNLSALTEILQLMLENPQLGEALGRQARAHVKEHFDFSRCITTYEKLYTRVIQARHVSG